MVAASPTKATPAMMAAIKRWLKLGDYQPQHHSQPASVTITENIEALDASSAKLNQAMKDTGFFLGDAMVRKERNERPRVRARHHHR